MPQQLFEGQDSGVLGLPIESAAEKWRRNYSQMAQESGMSEEELRTEAKVHSYRT